MIASPEMNPDAGGIYTGASKGDGIVVMGISTPNSYGRGAPANGGGGGNIHNSGGGGGSNTNSIGNPLTWYGTGIKNSIYTTAWQTLEGSSNLTSSGGGKGGYTWSNTSSNVAVDSLNNCGLWSADSRADTGGRGGRPLPQDSTTRLYFGGGGGAGDGNNNPSGNGGNGGGVVILLTRNAFGTNGRLSSRGSNGEPGYSDGAGGGGAGGSILMLYEYYDPSLNLVLDASGGKGGDTIDLGTACGPNCLFGSGGGGTGGQVFLQTISSNGFGIKSPSLSSPTQYQFNGLGGQEGISLNTPLANSFPPNGATAGESVSNTVEIVNSDLCVQARLPCYWIELFSVSPSVSVSSSPSLTPISSNTLSPSPSSLFTPSISNILSSLEKPSDVRPSDKESPPETSNKLETNAPTKKSTKPQSSSRETEENILKKEAKTISITSTVSAAGTGGVFLSISFVVLYYRRKKNKLASQVKLSQIDRLGGVESDHSMGYRDRFSVNRAYEDHV